jgi:hypothetical protein
MYRETKVISFKLEGKELQILENQAEKFGMSPGTYARRLLVEALTKDGSGKIIDRIGLLETRLINAVKEVFYVVLELPHEKFDQIVSRRDSSEE